MAEPASFNSIVVAALIVPQHNMRSWSRNRPSVEDVEEPVLRLGRASAAVVEEGE